MQCSFNTVGQALIAKLRGELDLHTSPQFKEEITKSFTTHPQIKYLIMDVKDLQFIDSSGLGVILGRYRELEERGGRLFFVEANPHIKRVLQMSGLQKISEFAGSTAEVLQRVEGGQL
ncbi:MAG TPA: anti-sigma factor antagonist [Firmicutes bacterium]|nr:anti-sigma factor antagonist [Bacillota bacterium]